MVAARPCSRCRCTCTCTPQGLPRTPRQQPATPIDCWSQMCCADECLLLLLMSMPLSSGSDSTKTQYILSAQQHLCAWFRWYMSAAVPAECNCLHAPHLQAAPVAELLQCRSTTSAIVVEIIWSVFGRHGSKHLPHLPIVRLCSAWIGPCIAMLMMRRRTDLTVSTESVCCSAPSRQSVRHQAGFHFCAVESLTRVPAMRCAAAAPAKLHSIEFSHQGPVWRKCWSPETTICTTLAAAQGSPRQSRYRADVHEPMRQSWPLCATIVTVRLHDTVVEGHLWIRASRGVMYCL
jgi:hypothetical protein